MLKWEEVVEISLSTWVGLALVLGVIVLIITKTKEIRIMSEIGDTLKGIADQLVKAKTEIVNKITDLETALNNAGTLPADAQDALTALKTTAQALDDIVPDVPA